MNGVLGPKRSSFPFRAHANKGRQKAAPGKEEEEKFWTHFFVSLFSAMGKHSEQPFTHTDVIMGPFSAREAKKFLFLSSCFQFWMWEEEEEVGWMHAERETIAKAGEEEEEE